MQFRQKENYPLGAIVNKLLSVSGEFFTRYEGAEI